MMKNLAIVITLVWAAAWAVVFMWPLASVNLAIFTLLLVLSTPLIVGLLVSTQ